MRSSASTSVFVGGYLGPSRGSREDDDDDDDDPDDTITALAAAAARAARAARSSSVGRPLLADMVGQRSLFSSDFCTIDFFKMMMVTDKLITVRAFPDLVYVDVIRDGIEDVFNGSL